MCQPCRKMESTGFQKTEQPRGREVNVWAMFVQNGKTIELKQPTKTELLHANAKNLREYMLFLSAARQDKGTGLHHQKSAKGLTRRGSLAGLFVKMDLFYPHFAAIRIIIRMPPEKTCHIFEGEDSIVRASFTNRYMPAVTVQAKRGGLRHYDPPNRLS